VCENGLWKQAGKQEGGAAKQRPKMTTAIAVRAAPEVGSLESAGVITPMISNDAKVVPVSASAAAC